MEWIAITDRLPSRDMSVSGFKQVLVVNDGNVQWALFNKKTSDFQDASFRAITKQVTHWMPLPSPPQAKEE